MLQRLTALPGHRFWKDDVSVTKASPFRSLSLVGHRQVTDAYLLALARANEGKLATLDRGIPSLVADHGRRSLLIEVIPAD